MWVWPVLAAPFVGSLAGVLVRRLPAGRPVFLARSECEACGQALNPLELVPLLSFITLRGRCRTCRAPIGWRHPAFELSAVAVALWAAAASLDGVWLWAMCGFGWTLLALAWIDAEHLVLPDALTLPLLLAGLAVTWRVDPDGLTDHAAAAALGWAALQSLALAYRRFRGRDGLGAGDAKLLGAIGAWVGVGGLSWVLLCAAVLGLALALPRALRRGTGGATMIPFGPCLALGGWLTALYLT